MITCLWSVFSIIRSCLLVSFVWFPKVVVTPHDLCLAKVYLALTFLSLWFMLLVFLRISMTDDEKCHLSR